MCIRDRGNATQTPSPTPPLDPLDVTLTVIAATMAVSYTHLWVRAEAIDVSSYQGQSIKFAFWAKLNATKNSNFFVDKVELCSNDDDRKPETARRCDKTAVP